MRRRHHERHASEASSTGRARQRPSSTAHRARRTRILCTRCAASETGNSMEVAAQTIRRWRPIELDGVDVQVVLSLIDGAGRQNAVAISCLHGLNQKIFNSGCAHEVGTGRPRRGRAERGHHVRGRRSCAPGQGLFDAHDAGLRRAHAAHGQDIHPPHVQGAARYTSGLDTATSGLGLQTTAGLARDGDGSMSLRQGGG